MVGGVAQALMLPLIAAATLYLRYRDADPRVGPGRLTDLLTWSALAGTVAVAGYTVFDRGKALAEWLSALRS